MRRVLRILLYSVVFLSVSVAYVFADDFSSTNFKVKDPVITVGGGQSTSGSYIQLEAVGQNAIGKSDSSNFIVKSGFLYWPAPSAASPATPAKLSVRGGDYYPYHLLPLFSLPEVVELAKLPDEEAKKKVTEEVEKCPYGPTDLNCDDIVGIGDFAIYLYLSGKSPDSNPADFNKDGLIDSVDISILFSDWSEERVLLEDGTFAPPGDVIASSSIEPEGSIVYEAEQDFNRQVAFKLNNNTRSANIQFAENQLATLGDITFSDILPLLIIILFFAIVFAVNKLLHKKYSS